MPPTTPSGRSARGSPRPTPPKGPNSARLPGRYGGGSATRGAPRGTPRTRGGRRVLVRPSQRGGASSTAWSKENRPAASPNPATATSPSSSLPPASPVQPGHGPSTLSMGRNVSKSTLAAISFAEEDHDDITRQCTSELETRLNEITSEEIKAATTLMRKMRKKCDWYHLAIKKKNETLKDLQKQIVRLQQKTERKDGHRGALRRRADVLKKTLAGLQETYSAQQMNMKIYGHMSKRLMKQVKQTDKAMTQVQQELSQVTKRHREMATLHQKLNHRKANLQKSRSDLRNKLRTYQERRTHALLKIERVIQESQLETQLIKDQVRDSEARRQGGSREDRMARLYHQKKQANLSMPKEFRDQTARMQRLEEAFLKIRNSTGLSDVNEIVAKFLHRDEKYEALCNAADAARQKIEALKAEKDDVQRAIAEFQGSSKSRNAGNRDLYKEVDHYDQKLSETHRKHQEAKDKSTRVRLLLEESRITVGRFLKTLSNFGDRSTGMGGGHGGGAGGLNDDPSRFVPSISSLPKALGNVKAQVAVMLEQLAVLLAADNERGGSLSHSGAKSKSKSSTATAAATSPSSATTFLTEAPVEAGPAEASAGAVGGDGAGDGTGPAGESGAAGDAGDDRHPTPHVSAVLENPKANQLIFNSLMNAAPDLSTQNLRVDRDKSTGAAGRESAVAHLLGIELPVLNHEEVRKEEADLSGIPGVEDGEGVGRGPRGWDAHVPTGKDLLERSRIKSLSKSLVDRRRRGERRDQLEAERAAAAAESDEDLDPYGELERDGKLKKRGGGSGGGSSNSGVGRSGSRGGGRDGRSNDAKRNTAGRASRGRRKSNLY